MVVLVFWHYRAESGSSGTRLATTMFRILPRLWHSYIRWWGISSSEPQSEHNGAPTTPIQSKCFEILQCPVLNRNSVICTLLSSMSGLFEMPGCINFLFLFLATLYVRVVVAGFWFRPDLAVYIQYILCKLSQASRLIASWHCRLLVLGHYLYRLLNIEIKIYTTPSAKHRLQWDRNCPTTYKCNLYSVKSRNHVGS